LNESVLTMPIFTLSGLFPKGHLMQYDIIDHQFKMLVLIFIFNKFNFSFVCKCLQENIDIRVAL